MKTDSDAALASARAVEVESESNPSPREGGTSASENTDREIWRERPGDFYAASIHVTSGGGIAINCGGEVIVTTVRAWHRAVKQAADTLAALEDTDDYLTKLIGDVEMFVDERGIEALRKWQAEVQAAIAKATGESP